MCDLFSQVSSRILPRPLTASKAGWTASTTTPLSLVSLCAVAVRYPRKLPTLALGPPRSSNRSPQRETPLPDHNGANPIVCSGTKGRAVQKEKGRQTDRLRQQRRGRRQQKQQQQSSLGDLAEFCSQSQRLLERGLATRCPVADPGRGGRQNNGAIVWAAVPAAVAAGEAEVAAAGVCGNK